MDLVNHYLLSTSMPKVHFIALEASRWLKAEAGSKKVLQKVKKK